MNIDKDKLIYDLSLICVTQCLNDISPSNMDDTCDYAVKSFNKACHKISELIKPSIKDIDAL